MNDHHYLSIIVPIYNAETYLRSCIESILCQTYKNFELLLIDDGSKDSSATIIDEYESSDNRVKAIHKVNGGCSSARNKGLDLAEGDLIAFVDADDVLDKRMYELLIENMDQYNADISACDFVKEFDESIDKNVNLSLPRIKPRLFSKEERYKSIPFIQGYVWNKVWKKDVLKNQYFREDVQIVDDAVYTWETLGGVNSICYISTPLYHYRIIPSSITRNSPMDKYMKALYGYEILIDGATQKERSLLDRFTTEYLQWNLAAFMCLAKKNKRDETIFNKIRSNIKRYSGNIENLAVKEKMLSYLIMMGYTPSLLFYRFYTKIL